MQIRLATSVGEPLNLKRKIKKKKRSGAKAPLLQKIMRKISMRINTPRDAVQDQATANPSRAKAQQATQVRPAMIRNSRPRRIKKQSRVIIVSFPFKILLQQRRGVFTPLFYSRLLSTSRMSQEVGSQASPRCQPCLTLALSSNRIAVSSSPRYLRTLSALVAPQATP